MPRLFGGKLMKRLLLVLGGLVALVGVQFARQNDATSVDSQRAMVNQYCVKCHNDTLKSGGFSWTTDLDLAHPEQNAKEAGKVIRKVRAGMMPPAGSPRPDAAALKGLVTGLESRIDLAAAKQ